MSAEPASRHARFRLLSNSRWNLIAFTSTLATHFILLPIVVRLIGLEDFGRASLALAIAAPLSAFGTVLGQTVTRELIAAEGAQISTRTLIETSRTLCLLLCLAGGTLIALLGPILPAFADAAADGGSEIRLAFLVLAAGWACQQLSFLYQGFVIARQDFSSVAKVAIGSGALTILATVVCTAAIGGEVGYLAGVTISLFLSQVLWVFAGKAATSGTRLLGLMNPLAVRGLSRFGRWQLLTQFAGVVAGQTDRYALASLGRPAVLGQYTAANRLSEAACIGVIKMAEVLFPHFGRTASAGEQQRSRFFLLSSWVVISASVLLLGPLVPTAHALMDRWVSPEAANGGALMLQVLVLGGIVGSGTIVFTYCAMGTGRSDLPARSTLIYALVTVVATLWLVSVWGQIAAGAGLLLASLVRVGLTLYFTRKDLFVRLPVTDLLASTVLPMVAGCAAALLLARSGFVAASSWPGIAVAYLICSLILGIVLLGSSLITPFGRSGIAELARLIRGRQSSDNPVP